MSCLFASVNVGARLPGRQSIFEHRHTYGGMSAHSHSGLRPRFYEGVWSFPTVIMPVTVGVCL